MATKKAAITDFEVDDTTSFAHPSSFLSDDLDGLVEDVEDENEDDDEDDDKVEIPEGEPEPEEKDEEEPEDTKQQDKESNEGDEDEEEFSFSPIAADLIEEGAWELPEGKKLEDYDDSLDGMRAMAKDAAEANIQAVIKSLPETAQRIFQLGRKGGTEQDLQTLLTLADGPDYSEVDLDDEDIQRSLVEEAMRLQDPDLTDEQLDEEIQDLIDLGKLEKQAAKSQKYLVKYQTSQQAEIEKQVEERSKAAEKAYQEELSSIRGFIKDTKDVAGLPVTGQDEEGFMAFLTVRGKDGKTAAERADTFERRIKMAYLNYKDFNVEKVKRAATTDATKEIKKTLGRYKQERPTSTGSRPVQEKQALEGRMISPQEFLASFNQE